ncbi:MAG: hypothetical protein NZL85_09460, partial [Fimbriimonadales bacterium]|nr:hypothetical protein [Fimbriimonadales bacterium]
MNALQQAVLEICSFLEQAQIPYVLIGGYAVQHWGEPRMTRDIDLEICVEEEQKESVFRQLLERFQPRYPDALQFALQQRVLLIYASNGVPVDITLALPGYEAVLMQRSVKVQIAPEAPPVSLISAEDLIVHKCLAHRPVDLKDVQTILKR